MEVAKKVVQKKWNSQKNTSTNAYFLTKLQTVGVFHRMLLVTAFKKKFVFFAWNAMSVF